ncbi:hypothetical protein PanWU01x14_175600 [Parasponia andersonii]|uniref:Uncharacterized protein n=1 Tax=Parasponia andersonii TaxID=3476 RepID=A0A2P5C7U1_PARAD|nr:hypothetical protein PanWU01x14_175600 [Parasponia andersonii]
MQNDSNSDTCPNGVQWSTLHPRSWDEVLSVTWRSRSDHVPLSLCQIYLVGSSARYAMIK